MLSSTFGGDYNGVEFSDVTAPYVYDVLLSYIVSYRNRNCELQAKRQSEETRQKI